MTKVCLAEVAEINPRGPTARELSPDYICEFVPMAAVSEAGQVIIGERRPYSDVSKGFTAFQNDDVLVAKSPTRNLSGADFRSCEPSHEKESKG